MSYDLDELLEEQYEEEMYDFYIRRPLEYAYYEEEKKKREEGFHLEREQSEYPKKREPRTNFIKSLKLYKEFKDLGEETIIEVLKEALIETYKEYAGQPEVKIYVDISDTELKVFGEWIVIDDSVNNYKKSTSIPLSEARKYSKDCKVGETINIDINIVPIIKDTLILAKSKLETKKEGK